MQDLKQMARVFIADYLALEREGYKLSSTIALVGGGRHVREMLAVKMGVELQLRERTDVKVEVEDGSAVEYPPRYLIDVCYFHKDDVLAVDFASSI